MKKIVFKIVSWPSYLYLWESYTWKNCIFYWNTALSANNKTVVSRIILGIGSGNGRRLYIVTPSFIGRTIPRMIPGSFLQYWPLYREIHPRQKGWQFAEGISWWRHQMETFSALLALYAGSSSVPVNSPHKGQWHGALMFSLIWVWINNSVNNWEAGDLIRHGGHYDVNVMLKYICLIVNVWISNDTSVKFVSRGLIAHKFRLVQVMAWHWRGDKPNKPLPNPMTWIILDISWSLIFWAWLV